MSVEQGPPADAPPSGSSAASGSSAPELPSGLLLIPAEGDPTLGRILRKVRLIAMRSLLTLNDTGDAQLTAAVKRLQPWLIASSRQDSDRVLGAIASPDVLGPLLSVGNEPVDVPAVLRELIPNFLVQLGGVSEDAFLWDLPIERLLSPKRGGAVTFAPAARGLVVDPKGVELTLHDATTQRWADASAGAAPVMHALGPQLPGPHLAQIDTNPLSMQEDHPDKRGNSLSLGEHPLSEWVDAYREAIDLVALGLPTLHAELGESLQRLVPVGFEPQLHLSASYRSAPGLIYATLHPHVLTLAEATIHETQHGKLNALMWLDPVLENGLTEWTPSPVRPDMRPLLGVLLAVHAFVPVAAMYLRLASSGHACVEHPRFLERWAQIMSGNTMGLETLERVAKPTPTGARMLADLRTLHDAIIAGGAPVSSASEEAMATL